MDFEQQLVVLVHIGFKWKFLHKMVPKCNRQIIIYSNCINFLFLHHTCVCRYIRTTKLPFSVINFVRIKSIKNFLAWTMLERTKHTYILTMHKYHARAHTHLYKNSCYFLFFFLFAWLVARPIAILCKVTSIISRNVCIV